VRPGLENAHSPAAGAGKKISPDSLLLLLDGITDPRTLGAMPADGRKRPR